MNFQFIPLKHVQWVFLHRYCIMVIMMAKAFTMNIIFKIKYLKILRVQSRFHCHCPCPAPAPAHVAHYLPIPCVYDRVSYVCCCCHVLDCWHRPGTSGDLQSWSPSTVPTSSYLLEELRRGGGILHREPNFPAAALQFHYHLLNLKINKAKK